MPEISQRRWPYAVCGLLAAVAGMAVGHLVAAFVNPSSSPVLAVGSTVVDATPTPVKEWAVSTLGTSDKPVLVASVATVTAAAAAGIGVVSRRRLGLAVVLLLAFVGLAAAAALTRPNAGSFDLIPSLIAAVAGVVTLVGLRSTLARKELVPDRHGWTPRTEGEADNTSRRVFLTAAGAVTVGALVAVAVGNQKSVNTTVPTAADLPIPVEPLPPLPAGAEKTVPGITPFQTPNADFYRIDTALILPNVDAGDWTLEVDGDVDHPFSITYAELLDMDMIERDITLNCVSNEVGGPYISSARWLGVRTRDLLHRAGVHDTADQILSRSTDGMTISTPVRALLDDRDAMVAVAMNGQPLPRAHGFPARLVTPGLYGYVGATKWLAKMTATTYAAQMAYWTKRGWAQQATVLTQSRIDTPSGRDAVGAGRVMIGGVAWAQERGIEKVEIRVDDGAWQEATLGPDAGIDYWRQWYVPWDATPGEHTLSSRATDGTGKIQTEARTDPFPRGATGWDFVVVNVE